MKIKSIKIEIAGNEIELSIEEAQELKRLLDGLLAEQELPTRQRQYPPVIVPFVQFTDACINNGAHDYPSHQVGIVTCRKCGKPGGNPITWTATTGGTSGTGAGDYFYVNAKKENQS